MKNNPKASVRILVIVIGMIVVTGTKVMAENTTESNEPKELVEAREIYHSQINNLTDSINKKYLAHLKTLQKSFKGKRDASGFAAIQKEIDSFTKTDGPSGNAAKSDHVSASQNSENYISSGSTCDLAITQYGSHVDDKRPDPEGRVWVGLKLYFFANITNTGSVPSEATTVHFLVDGAAIDAQPVAPIKPGEMVQYRSKLYPLDRKHGGATQLLLLCGKIDKAPNEDAITNNECQPVSLPVLPKKP